MAIIFTAAGIVADAVHRASRRQVEAIDRLRAELASEPAQCGLVLGEPEIQLAELVAENFPDSAWATPILAEIRQRRRGLSPAPEQ